ncbi:pentapeptide repeat-containing protein [Nocardia bovistercoris]|uniref:Pentapeptide repeat-containing protein n=1 Tax=Nocardia bovistercoris TaxID=2785916 RepID=A0A931N110_9NOCA|nr:pentapeptide repeat-containing protein [Nocardia bovistercoris]MBH0775207.1 pentapeptide repeat-containing protein [Nocardia bovistercoris]
MVWGWVRDRMHRAETPNQVDLTKIALSVTAGVGGAVALVVAYRRQRDLERGRFAELFGAAAKQLGDADPAVRLAGVYAMAGVADEFSARARRQQCVDVLCGYLRLPYDVRSGADHLVSRSETSDESGIQVARTYQVRHNDREVRSAVVGVIANHLRRYSEVSWSRCAFDFTGAVFEDADFEAVEFGGRLTDFTRARFVGERGTDFRRARFTGGHLTFRDAVFDGTSVSFERARFDSARTTFDGGVVSAPVSFVETRFRGARTTFIGTRFEGARTSFTDARFDGATVSFERAVFAAGRIGFERARFANRHITFASARYQASAVDFTDATLGAHRRRPRAGTGDLDFTAVEFHAPIAFTRATFAARHATFTRADFFGDISFDGVRFHTGETTFENPTAWVGLRFDWDDGSASKPLCVKPDTWPPAPPTPS